MKTKELGRKHLEHLLNIGYATTFTVEELIDSPYILIKDNSIKTCSSVKDFNDFSGELKTKEQILKCRPLLEKTAVKKLSHKEQKIFELMRLLNTKKYSQVTGYDVSWTVQAVKNEHDRYQLLPISPHACGSISMEHLEIILEFAKKNTYLHPTLSYTNYNGEKERYGTYTPCIYFY